jgi:sigma-B regulation protein RsbU (phosphoserine phosphatase)
VGDGEVTDAFIGALLDDDAQQLYDEAPCGYLSTTPDGTIIKANATFFALTGYQREDLVGKRRFVELLTTGGRIYHETHYAPMLSMQGTAREIAFDLVRADGSRLPVLVNSVLQVGADGTPVVVRTAVFDASQRRRYELELLHQKQRAEASEARATALARTLQQTLVPPVLPEIPGLMVAAAYHPAGDGAQVGGDFYDVFQSGDGWLVALGDVCGKGVEAAVVTSLARYTLRAAAVEDGTPSHALAVLNDVLRRDGSGRFCTVVLLRCQPDGDAWQVTACSAGHPLPLLADQDGSVEPVGEHGTLVGVLPALRLHEVTLTLRPGEAVVLYTDGVPEARDGGEFYGEGRAADVLTRAHAEGAQLPDALLADVLEYEHDLPRDDIAIVAVTNPRADP